MSDVKLVVKALAKSYPVGRKRSVEALAHIDLEVETGSFVCIVGASGCGKSTLLNIAGGLEVPTSGSVEIDGEPVIGPGPDRGMVFQTYSLYPWKSVRANIAFGLECSGWPKDERAARIDELLGVTSLAQYADLLPHELSGGMRQRVAIARALAPAPDVLLLDEPFGALDAQTKRAMQEFLISVWNRTSSTILMVTHDVEEAIYLSQRIYVFAARPGRVAQVIDIPFGRTRGPNVRRDPRFVDLRADIEESLTEPVAALGAIDPTEVVGGAQP